MSLSKIPVEVVEDHIFKFLAWNDLLRLRRVSKECHTLVQGYWNTEKGSERAPQIPIGPSSTTGDIPGFKTLTAVSIPTTKIYFRNSYKIQRKRKKPNPEIKALMEKYGGQVKHLRLQQFSTHPMNSHTDTAQLLQGLPNLESLSLDRFIIGHVSSQHFPPVLPPSVFKNLKALDLHVVMLGIYHIVDMHDSLTIWLTECRSLETLRLSMKSSYHSVSMAMRRVLEELILAVQTGNNWKSIEFDVYSSWVDDRTVDPFQRLLTTCAAKNVGVAGVHGDWLGDRRAVQYHQEFLITSTITDLRVDEDAPDLQHLKLDKLTTLEITSAALAFGEGEGPEGPWWSTTLQTLILTLASGRVNVVSLFRRLSWGRPLLALQEVSLKFANAGERRSSHCLEQLIQIAPNLKELTLVNWSGSPFALARLLPRIQGLEKLSLVNCRRLEDAAFVGNDPKKPAFLELKNLRRLSVKNKRYPATGLTAKCFATVFRNMSLTHFEMCAEEFTLEFQERCKWMKILLKKGRFAESIQEIKWNGCRLHLVQDKKLQDIGKAFRSFKML